MSTKREYSSPSIEKYGTVEEVTRGGGAPGGDGQGTNSAYSPGSPKA